MSKRDIILSRFPDFVEAQNQRKLLYQVVAALAQPLEAVDRQLAEMMWSHWVNRSLDVQDLERIAALVGIQRFDGEPRERFRRRLKALARILLDGANTPSAVLQVAAATLDLDIWDDAGRPRLTAGPAPATTLAWAAGYRRPLLLVETPWKDVAPEPQLVVNGQLFEVSQNDFEPVTPTVVVVGVADRTVEPVVANLTTGRVVGYLGTVPDGQRLEIMPDGRGMLDGVDVSRRLFSLHGGFYDRDSFSQARTRFVRRWPSGVFDGGGLDQAGMLFAAGDGHARVPQLPTGRSDWQATATVGRFGRTAYDRAVWSAPDPDLFPEGSFDQGAWSQAIFQLEPSLQLEMRWQERERTMFELRVPWANILNGPQRVEQEGLAFVVDPDAAALAVHQTRRLRFQLYKKTVTPGQAIDLGGALAAGARNPTVNYFALLRCRPSLVDCTDPAAGQVTLARLGVPIYLDDAAARLSRMPEGFDYLTLVQTASADRQSTIAQAVQLIYSGAEPVSLYVAYDALAVAVPTWLRAGWTRLAQGIEVSEELLALTRPLGSAPCALAWLERTFDTGVTLIRLLVADSAGFVHVLDPRELRRLVEHDPAADDDEVDLAHLPVGEGACHIALLLDYRHPDWAVARSLAYVACSEAGQVAVIDLDELESLVVGDPEVTVQDVVQTIDVGRGVTAVSLLPDRHEAQALNLLDRSITTIDLGANRPVETRPAALPHERLAGELDRVRSAGVRARVVYTD